MLHGDLISYFAAFPACPVKINLASFLLNSAWDLASILTQLYLINLIYYTVHIVYVGCMMPSIAFLGGQTKHPLLFSFAENLTVSGVLFIPGKPVCTVSLLSHGYIGLEILITAYYCS